MLLALAVVVLLGACGGPPGLAVTPAERIRLSEKGGLVLPTDAVIVFASDGGGRDPHHKFFEWGVIADREIALPGSSSTPKADYLELPLQNSLRAVQATIPHERIKRPKAALGAYWRTNGLEFNALWIVTDAKIYYTITQTRVN